MAIIGGPESKRDSLTTCCVVGGGPAGMMLGYLLARSGVHVTVLEKHADFFRDFRGDTVHPSTLELLFELGLLEDFLRLPHQELSFVSGTIGDFVFKGADFRRLPTRCKFVALVPQWDFLNFLADRAKQFSTFELRMRHEAVGLLEKSGKIVGVTASTPEGESNIRADLVVACDGRHSTIRRAAELALIELGVPIDVLWFRISRTNGDPEQLLGKMNYGGALVLINRGDYFQVGFIIRKDSFDEIKSRGLPEFRNRIRKIAPYLGGRVDELQTWDEIKLLSVQINRLPRWHRPGLLCIGDAAHAMSPAGGVGINLAVQDAVAAANILGGPLRDKAVTEEALARVQQRREFPTRATQFLQTNAHKALQRVFKTEGPVQIPWQMKLALKIPRLQVVLARVIGVGIRPEHVGGASRTEADMRRGRRVALCAGILAGIGLVAIRRRS